LKSITIDKYTKPVRKDVVMFDNYWNRTDQILQRGGPPGCPKCGKAMAAVDDHGRFRCFSCNGFPGAAASALFPRATAHVRSMAADRSPSPEST